MSVSLSQALALRRALIAVAALAATVGAHALATGELHLLPTAPVSWGWIVLGALVFGPRRAPWRRRRAAETLGLLCGAQALLHLLLSAAPWSLGLAVHHPEPWVTASALAAHAAAALGLALLLARAEGLLTAALRVVRRVRRMLAPRMAGGPPLILVAAAPAPPLPSGRRSAHACRGPPAPRDPDAAGARRPPHRSRRAPIR